jgi:hypothetical protein
MGLRADLLNQKASLKRQAVEGTYGLSAQVELCSVLPNVSQESLPRHGQSVI